MSSSDDNAALSQVGSKKRRLPHACDNCRKRKVKCDSARTNGRCTNCVSFDIACEHTIPSRRRGAQKEYVESLEGRIKMMEDLLAMHARNASNEHDSISSSSPPVPTTDGASASSQTSPAGIVEREDEYERVQSELVSNMNCLRVTDCRSRYFGPASTFHLVSTALYVKAKSDQVQTGEAPNSQTYMHFNDQMKTISWEIMPWEGETMKEEPYQPFEFPEDDLLQHLIDVYFETPNTLLPILHRPTFERELRQGLHKTDWYFGAVLLMVCASASKYTNDRRVLLPGYDDWRSAGWQWFRQVPLIRRQSLFMLPTVHELQLCSPASWPILGISLRYCQELGIHRKLGEAHFAHSEHWTRVFWSLICMDRLCSSFLGRQPCISADDIDADLPVECDDEYWETGNPTTVFKQPAHVASKITFFTHYAKLTEILSHALSALYTTNKSRIRLGNVGPEWEQRIAAELDSELNQWIEDLPDHLRWDPKREDRLFFNQSSVLYATYYHVQHAIHRPFMGKSSPVTFASIAMCCNAARACSRIFAAQADRGNPIVTSELMVTAFTSAVSCLMNVWGGRKLGMTIDQKREMEYVHHCIRYLSAIEHKWYLAGRFKEQIISLTNLQDSAQTPDYVSKKRPRAETPPMDAPSSSASTSTSHTTPSDGWYMGADQTCTWNGEDQAYWNVNNLLFPQTDPSLEPQLGMAHDQVFGQEGRFDSFVPTHGQQDPHAPSPHNMPAPTLEGLTAADLAALPVPMNDVFDMWSQLPVTYDVQTWDSYLNSMEQPKENAYNAPGQPLFPGH
ncbi:fungal-specific transcription factor domain-containing protein [Schizophyllum fasciatum]